MAEIIKKIANAGKIYSIGGGSTPVEEVEHKVVTQEEFDVIPQEEKVKNVYMIKGEAEPTPTPGGGTAIEMGDMLMSIIDDTSDNDSYFFADNSTTVRVNNKMGITRYSIYRSSLRYSYIMQENLYILIPGSNGYKLTKINLDSLEETVLREWGTSANLSIKFSDYIYIENYSTYTKMDYEGNESESSKEEYDNVPSGLYYKGLYYSQDGDDYVSKDVNGNEVKRYVGVGTIDGIFDGKLYRNVGGNVSYAIATI